MYVYCTSYCTSILVGTLRRLLSDSFQGKMVSKAIELSSASQVEPNTTGQSGATGQLLASTRAYMYILCDRPTEGRDVETIRLLASATTIVASKKFGSDLSGAGEGVLSINSHGRDNSTPSCRYEPL